MTLHKKNIDKENSGTMKLNDDILDKASGGSKQYQAEMGRCLLQIGDSMYIFDNEKDAESFRNGYYTKKGAKATASPIIGADLYK